MKNIHQLLLLSLLMFPALYGSQQKKNKLDRLQLDLLANSNLSSLRTVPNKSLKDSLRQIGKLINNEAAHRDIPNNQEATYLQISTQRSNKIRIGLDKLQLDLLANSNVFSLRAVPNKSMKDSLGQIEKLINNEAAHRDIPNNQEATSLQISTQRSNNH